MRCCAHCMYSSEQCGLVPSQALTAACSAFRGPGSDEEVVSNNVSNAMCRGGRGGGAQQSETSMLAAAAAGTAGAVRVRFLPHVCHECCLAPQLSAAVASGHGI